MSKFSGAVQLTDLDDFISPSQACVNPVAIDKANSQVQSIEIGDDGKVREVSASGSTQLLKSAKISLNDCLACSGCVTSAETVLIGQQSVEEFLIQMRGLAKFGASPSEGSKKYRLCVVSLSPQARASVAAHFNISQSSAFKKLTTLFKKLGADHVFDTSWSRRISLLEMSHEFLSKYNASLSSASASSSPSSSSSSAQITLIAGICPGWVCYAEKTQGEKVLEYMSTTKSPQQVMGTVIKRFFAQKNGVKPQELYHVGVMPCFDKKLEASRDDFIEPESGSREVDCVLTATEILQLLEETATDFMTLEESPLDPLFSDLSEDGSSLIGIHGGSGGYADFVLRYAANSLSGANQPESAFVVKQGRNADLEEVDFVMDSQPILRFARVYGFRNIQNLVRKIKIGKCPYHFVEVMACPGGCLNGGGQIRAEAPETPKDLLARVQTLYESTDIAAHHSVEQAQKQRTPADATVSMIYKELIDGDVYSEKSIALLHTGYHLREKMSNGLTVKW